MFQLALLIGLYSYSIYGLGILGLLYPQYILSLSSVAIILLLIIIAKSPLKRCTFYISQYIKKSDKLIYIFLILFFLQVVINLLGALGPELAFDALWYHLTLPKLFLIDHAVYHIPGGLLYYSDMPKLTEMLYVGALSMGNEITAKCVHYLFGILSCIALFVLAKKHGNTRIALLSVVIFYTNLVVGWLSITAYIDLARTFFEICAFYYFLEWYKSKSSKDLVLTGILLGFAVTTKLVAFGSVGVFFILVLYISWKQKLTFRKWFSQEMLLILGSIIIPLPWLLFSYIHTGNPFYPLFSPIFSGINQKVFDSTLLYPVHIISTFWNVFTRASDPVSPLYLILLPLAFFYFKYSTDKMRILFYYIVLAFLVWYATSQVEGSRMLVPYLPIFSWLCSAVIDYFIKSKNKYGHVLPNFLLALVVVTALISIAYRGAANKKYIPVLLGQQTKQEFLTAHLNFGFSDFYDTDNYFTNHIKPSDKVLLYGFHNLYYVDFPFIDSSWVKPGDGFNYIAVQKTELPKRFEDWQLIYTNAKTMVKLYRPSEKVCQKLCIY